MKDEKNFLTPNEFTKQDETKYVPSMAAWIIFISVAVSLLIWALIYVGHVASTKSEPPEGTTIFAKDDLEMELIGIYMLNESGERTENLLDVELEDVDYPLFQFVVDAQYAADFKVVNHTDKTDALTLSVRSKRDIGSSRLFSLDVYLDGINQDEGIARCMARDVWTVEQCPSTICFQYTPCYMLSINGEEEEWRYWESSNESVVKNGLMTQYLLDDTEFVIQGGSEQIVSIRFNALEE